ncbi:hypothetical protein GCM10029964_018640 [Kibdelosporangium lantanae]
MAPAEHRTVVVVDVVGFSAPTRTHVHHSVVRTALYTLLEQAFSSIGVRWDECYHEDRGDGVLVTVPSTVAKSAFVALPTTLLDRLTEHNSRHPRTNRSGCGWRCTPVRSNPTNTA